jgi:hypothetical protein
MEGSNVIDNEKSEKMREYIEKIENGNLGVLKGFSLVELFGLPDDMVNQMYNSRDEPKDK